MSSSLSALLRGGGRTRVIRSGQQEPLRSRRLVQGDVIEGPEGVNRIRLRFAESDRPEVEVAVLDPCAAEEPRLPIVYGVATQGM